MIGNGNGAWKPTKQQIALLADCATARLDTAKTSALLGIDEVVLIAWRKRLEAGAIWEQRMEAEEIARPVPQALLMPR
jgi:hypothetical protein